MSIFENYQSRFETTQQAEMSLEEYLIGCREDKSMYATAAERLLMAIGEPEMVDTSKDPRLSRIFSNKVIKTYPTFDGFTVWRMRSNPSCRFCGMPPKD